MMLQATRKLSLDAPGSSNKPKYLCHKIINFIVWRDNWSDGRLLEREKQGNRKQLLRTLRIPANTVVVTVNTRGCTCGAVETRALKSSVGASRVLSVQFFLGQQFF
jgi:hypothetical protein